MSVVDFLKSVGGVTVPDDVIRQAKEKEKEEADRRNKERPDSSHQEESRKQ